MTYVAKINGTYFSLHRQIGRFLYPYYKEGLEFREEMNLADYFSKPAPYYDSLSYSFTGLEPEEEHMANMEHMFVDIVPDKSLFFNESNSAHHLTYFLANEAARRLGSAKLLVINFDQHMDFGTPTGRFFCGSWGSRICNSGCDYMVVGCNRRVTSFKAGEKTGKVYDLTQLSECITKRHGDCVKIYVTVDMDVLENPASPKRTNWNPGLIDRDSFIGLLTSLPADKITAADITGFPPVNTNLPEEALNRLRPYAEDVRLTAEILCRLMGIEPYII